MENMVNHGTGWMRMEYLVPARGLIGFRTEFMTETRGTGQLHHVFEGYEPWHGDLRTRPTGSLVADRRGSTTQFALLNLQERGSMFVGPGEEVYEGMIVGENSRSDDMDVNPTKEKKLTNMRQANAEEFVRLIPKRELSLEQALEFLREDECVEVTPNHVRLRKVLLAAQERLRACRRGRPPEGRLAGTIRQERSACDERGDLVGGHRTREPETLRQAAAVRPQEDVLALGLDAFGERHHVEALGDLDHRPHHPRQPDVLVDVPHELPVDLQHVDRHVLESGKRRVSGAEVVEGEPQPHAGSSVRMRWVRSGSAIALDSVISTMTCTGVDPRVVSFAMTFWPR